MLGFMIPAVLCNIGGIYFAMLVIKGPLAFGLAFAAGCFASGMFLSIGISLCIYIAIKEAQK